MATRRRQSIPASEWQDSSSHRTNGVITGTSTCVVHSSRIQNIQASMTERCIELLSLPTYPEDPSVAIPSMLLDIGCGSGLSGELLTEEGHQWVGVDIAPSMLEVALEREVEGDLFLHDIGQGFGFRAGSFDGAIRYVEKRRLCSFFKLLSNL